MRLLLNCWPHLAGVTLLRKLEAIFILFYFNIKVQYLSLLAQGIIVLFEPFNWFLDSNVKRREFEIRDILHQLCVISCLFILTIGLGRIKLEDRKKKLVQVQKVIYVYVTYSIFALEIHCLDNTVSNVLNGDFVFLTNRQDNGINFLILSQSPDKELGQITRINELTKRLTGTPNNKRGIVF